MIAPARRAAFAALMAVERGTHDAASAFARECAILTDPRDYALAGEIVHGVPRWQAALDAALAPLVSRPLAELEPQVLVTLRMGAYQRLFLTRIPASAAVNDAVSLVRTAGAARASGLVNAVLRRLDPESARRNWPSRPSPDAPREALLDYLSITGSHPRWLVERWLDRYRFDATAAWVAFNNQPARITIRPVAWRTDRVKLAARLAAEGVDTEPARFARDALVIQEGAVLRTAAAREGLFLVQDEASQLVSQLVVDLAPGFVLDACAAPGGKTVALRGGLASTARIIAADLRPRRLRLLQATLARARAAGISLVRTDFARGAPFRAAFELVFVDAPCSGLGTIRRDPDIRWRRQPRDLPELAANQLEILTHAASCARPGGHVVYATCSSEPEENTDVVARFLAQQPAFARRERSAHPWVGSALEELVNARGDLETQPHRHGLEAFYAAVLVRNS